MRLAFRWIVVVSAAVVLAACGSDDDKGPAEPDVNAAPTDVRWEPYQGISLPFAEQGPTKIDAGAATGFNRSPQGAALAAISHTIRLSVAPDDQWPKIAAVEILPGPARDEWSINRVQLSITAPVAKDVTPRVLGYKIGDYSDDRATLTIYTEYPDSSRAGNKATVVWSAEDWKLQLPDTSSTENPVSVVTDLPGDVVKLEGPKT